MLFCILYLTGRTKQMHLNAVAFMLYPFGNWGAHFCASFCLAEGWDSAALLNSICLQEKSKLPICKTTLELHIIGLAIFQKGAKPKHTKPRTVSAVIVSRAPGTIKHPK